MQLPTIRAGMPHISGAGDEVMMSIAGHVSRASEESNPRDRCFGSMTCPYNGRSQFVCVASTDANRMNESFVMDCSSSGGIIR